MSGVAGAGGVSLRGAWRNVETELLNYRETWKGSMFSAFAAPVLYLGAIGFGLGSLVDADAATLGADVEYVAYLAPGLVAATALQVGSQEAIFGTMGRIKWRRTWQTAVATPMMPGDIAVGHLLWCGLRGGIAALVYALVTVLLGILPPLAALGAVAPAVLCGLALEAAVAAWLVTAQDEHLMNVAQRFLVIPMFLFSGVFFPVAQLPDWLEPVARATPLWHGVELARRVALGVPTDWPVLGHVGYLVLFTAVGLAVALRTFPRRLTS